MQNAQKRDRIGIERASDKLSKTYNEAHFSRNIKMSQKCENIKNVKILRSRKYHHILRSATSAKLTCQLEKN